MRRLGRGRARARARCASRRWPTIRTTTRRPPSRLTGRCPASRGRAAQPAGRALRLLHLRGARRRGRADGRGRDHARRPRLGQPGRLQGLRADRRQAVRRGRPDRTHPSHRATVAATEAGTYMLRSSTSTSRRSTTRCGRRPAAAARAPPTHAPPAGRRRPPDRDAGAARRQHQPRSGGRTDRLRSSRTLRGDGGRQLPLLPARLSGRRLAGAFDARRIPPDAGARLTTGLIVYGPTAGREYLGSGTRRASGPRRGAFRSDERGNLRGPGRNYGPRPVGYQLDVTRGS